MEQITHKSRCVGCKVCKESCPVDAICFKRDHEGFWYPTIDQNKCIDCKKCVEVCPANKTYVTSSESKEVYAAWNNDEVRRLNSTSGGIFFAIAKYIIAIGGYVVGAKYSKDFRQAYHTITNSLEGLNELMGSKYFQSDTEKIYKKIYFLLQENIPVLFCGAPCQVAALKSYLKIEYKHLFTMDFICYGINSQKAFAAFLDEREKEAKSKVKKVQLKNKIKGWQSLATYIEFENGKLYLKDREHDLWIQGYIKDNLYMRPSCFSCGLRNKNQADITVGDFWGIQRVSLDSLKKGVSAVICNTGKGKILFNSIKDDLTIKESDIETVIEGNPSLLYDPPKSENRDLFFRLIDILGFDKTVLLCRMKCQLNMQLGSLHTFKAVFQKSQRIVQRMRKEEFYETLQRQYDIQELDMPLFIKLNYLSDNVVREDGVYLIPFKNAVVNLHKSSRIIALKRNIEIGLTKLHKSQAETLLRMAENAVWLSEGGASLYYNTTTDICRSAVFKTGYFNVNAGCVIVCAKKISLGEDVMMGRNNIIYDSDHHQILDKEGRVINKGKEVVIEDKVWLTSNVHVLKGAHIGRDTIVASYTTITGKIEQGSMVAGGAKPRVLRDHAKWSREGVR